MFMQRVSKICNFQNHYIKIASYCVLAFLSTYFIDNMFKVDQSHYPISNSIFSVFIFIGIFLLYKKAFHEIDVRLMIISAIYGFFFALCMIFGTNLLLYEQTKINQPVIWIQIFAEMPLFMAIIIVLFQVWKRRSNRACVLDKFLERKFTVKKVFLFSWFLIFLAWLPGLIASFPGIYGYDSIYQLTYYVTQEISLHHPLAHTYLLGFCVWTLGNIMGDLKLGMLVYCIVQMCCLSGVFATISAYMAQRKCPGIIRILFLVLFMFLPTNALMSFSSTKDILHSVFFAILILLFTCVADNPKVLKEKRFFVILIVFSFLQIIFRSQGIVVFVFGMLIALIIMRKYWKRLIALLLISLTLYGVYSGPITELCNGKKANSIQEMMSVPCMQLAKAAIDNEEELTDAEMEKIEDYIPDYTVYYDLVGISDPLKNTFNSDLFKEEPLDFIRLWLSVGRKAPVAYIDAFGRLTIGLWYPDMNYRDPEAYHPYWEYKSTQQMEGDIPRVIVERNTPDNMQWLADFYDKLSYENTYQKIPVVSMFFSSGMTCWIMLLYAGWCIYIKKYKHLVAFTFVFGLWLTLLLGPVVLYRYIYPIVISDAVFAGCVFSKIKGD